MRCKIKGKIVVLCTWGMGWYVSWGDLLVPQLYFKHPPSWTVGLNWDSIMYSVFVAWVYSCTYIWQLFIIFVKFYILANYVTSTSQSCLAVRLKANSGSVKSSRINFSLYSWPKMHQHYSGIHTCQGASGDCQNFSVHFSGRSNHLSEVLFRFAWFRCIWSHGDWTEL